MLIMKNLFYILLAFISFNLNAQSSTQDLLLKEEKIIKDTCDCLGIAYVIADSTFGSCTSNIIKYYKVTTWKTQRTLLWDKLTDKKLIKNEYFWFTWEKMPDNFSEISFEIFQLGCAPKKAKK